MTTCVSREEVEGVEVGEVVSAVYFDGLQETDRHPQPYGHQVSAHKENSYKEPRPQHCEGVRGEGREGVRE